MLRGRSLLVLFPLVAIFACSSSSDDDGKANGNKGFNCSKDGDCTAKLAQCVSDGSSQVCTGPLDDHPFDRECEGATEAAAATCPGLVCVSLKPNVQQKKGICSSFCFDDTDCPGGRCILAVGYSLCFHACATNADCANGFLCGADGLCSVALQ